MLEAMLNSCKWKEVTALLNENLTLLESTTLLSDNAFDSVKNYPSCSVNYPRTHARYRLMLSLVYLDAILGIELALRVEDKTRSVFYEDIASVCLRVGRSIHYLWLAKDSYISMREGAYNVLIPRTL
jgi:hypothetical protein